MSSSLKTARLLVYFVFFFPVLTPSIAFAEVTPQTVLTKLNQISPGFKLIAQHMGISPRSCNQYYAVEASPREVFFQAIRLKFKINALLSEVIERPILAEGIEESLETNLNPAEVLNVVNDIDSTLQKILKHLDIKYTPNSFKAPNKTVPSDVYNQLLTDNTLLNQLVEKKTLPKDVFRVSTLSLYYAGEILASMNVSPPDLTLKREYKNKTPKDVFELQLEIISNIQNLSKHLNIKMLSLIKQNCTEKITPNDVEELAYIVLSELFYIAKHQGISVSGIKSYFPGKKYPSDVFQRNTVLLHEIKMIIKKISS